MNRILLVVDNLEKQTYLSSRGCVNCNNKLTLRHSLIGPKHPDPKGKFDCKKCNFSGYFVQSKNELNKKDSFIADKWVPDYFFPDKFYKDRFSYKGIKKVRDLFTCRNEYILSELLFNIKEGNYYYTELLNLAFSNTILHSSKLKSENIRPLGVNSYWIPDDYIEENPCFRFRKQLNNIIKAKKMLKDNLPSELGIIKLINASSLNTNLDTNSVDYIITDPPYGDAIQYAELSFVWNAWFNEIIDYSEEIIINPKQNKGVTEFINLMEKSIIEAKRVLKKDKFYTLCFSNKDFVIWYELLNLFKKYGFELINIELHDARGHSYNKSWSKYNPKKDVYITFKNNDSKVSKYKEYDIKKLVKELKNKKHSNLNELMEKVTMILLTEFCTNNYSPNKKALKIKTLIEYINNGS